MNIIIPMSGLGTRFMEAGYEKPKFLIEIEEKPIIQHVVDRFDKDDNFIFVKLVTICLLLVLFAYILAYFKVLDSKQASYVGYGVFILFGGIALIKIFKTLVDKNKSNDNKLIKNKSTVKNP